MYPRLVASVKGTRRRSPLDRAGLAVGLGILAVAGCSGCPDDLGAAREGEPLPCGEALRLPENPRLVFVHDDGRLEPGPACSSANCFVAEDHVLAWRDADVIRAEVHGRALALPPRPGSPIRPRPTLPGVAAADHVLIVDRGEELELHEAGGVRRLPMPPLAPIREWTFDAFDGGLVARSYARGGPPREIEIVPPATAPPVPGSRPVAAAAGQLGGWLVPGERMRFVDVDGRGFDIADAPPPGVRVRRLAGGGLLVHTPSRTLWREGQSPYRLPSGAHLHDHAGAIVLFGSRVPGVVALLDGEELLPIPTGVPRRGVVMRVQAVSRGPMTLLVERLQLDDCRVLDRLSLFDHGSRATRVLAEDDALRLHPRSMHDRFVFLEADPSYAALEVEAHRP
jgi:hypothetical protein